MPRTLRIAVLEKDRERALMIVDGLREQGDYDVVVFGDETGLARKLANANPDVVLIDLENPNRDMLEEMALASSPLERPVAMFTDSSNEELTRAAIEAGVSAYVVDGLQKDRIKPIIDAAIARFHMVTRMRTELATTRAALKERKTIDRAKGILMSARKCDEAEAYKILRKAAMDQGKKVGDVAAALVASAELLR
ncbi:MAG TPA: ANTAR domain-containing protein [Paracoccaceae bacterium]|nr:ANTAR domain-containing protein [Paracoccaceae bacterium]